MDLSPEEHEKIVENLVELREELLSSIKRRRKQPREEDFGEVIVGGCVLNEDNSKGGGNKQTFPFGDDEDLFVHDDLDLDEE